MSTLHIFLTFLPALAFWAAIEIARRVQSTRRARGRRGSASRRPRSRWELIGDGVREGFAAQGALRKW